MSGNGGFQRRETVDFNTEVSEDAEGPEESLMGWKIVQGDSLHAVVRCNRPPIPRIPTNFLRALCVL